MMEQRVCKLCLKASNDIQTIEEITREILDVLLLKIDFSSNEDYVICESCADSINTFFKFKSVCLMTQDHLGPFTKSMNDKEVDIKQISYLKENSGADTISNSDDAICQFCLKRDHCVDLNILNENFGEDITAKCIPEVDIKFSGDPKICLSCQTSLVNYYRFVTRCLANQENIVECHDRGTCLAIKSEELDIKPEKEYDSAIPSEDTQIKSFMDKSYNQETNHMFIKSDPNQDASKVTTYQCTLCSVKTKLKSSLTRHMLIHKDASEVTTYQCTLCSYKAKKKSSLNRHMLIHKDASEITTYQCPLCSYKAKFKYYLTRHMLIHKDASEVRTHQCTLCSYKAKHKSNLAQHMLIHKDASEAKLKNKITRHMLIHKHVSEVTTYDCSFCSYKAKQKSFLTKHMLIHKDASEIKTYQCVLCPYKAKFKYYLTKHMLIHQDLSNKKDLRLPIVFI
ncbi:hypothetical protein NQ318_013061 [Aromia moschata]|uniref:C2H2-type domain-containing protein n=1 Tax=Aromia moschata TaxID=1265417 RepID=A0AAV8XF30_9CUCU|nr:hypothetical protein NQ318_013061 [Aromia moschata]